MKIRQLLWEFRGLSYLRDSDQIMGHCAIVIRFVAESFRGSAIAPAIVLPSATWYRGAMGRKVQQPEDASLMR
jgi:hypothetical protein